MNQAELDRVWYGDKTPGPLLSTLESVYRAASSRRRERDRARAASDLAGKPIVVVGNLTAGGTGKTPLVIWLCEHLKAAGLKPAVISRGYGREGRAPVRVGRDTSPAEGGDEPVLIARRADVPVFVDRDRESAARAALAWGADVVIADDGLQRLRLPRVLEICVIDGQRGFGNGRLLPAGPLREPVDRLATVDWLVVNGEHALDGLPKERTLNMALVPDAFIRLDGNDTIKAADAADRLQDRAACAVTAIGNPDRFFRTLTDFGIDPDVRRHFNDHHVYSRPDFDGLEGAVLMTEKDAVKCGGLGLDNAWFVRISAALQPGGGRALLDDIVAHVDSAKEHAQ